MTRLCERLGISKDRADELMVLVNKLIMDNKGICNVMEEIDIRIEDKKEKWFALFHLGCMAEAIATNDVNMGIAICGNN